MYPDYLFVGSKSNVSCFLLRVETRKGIFGNSFFSAGAIPYSYNCDVHWIGALR